MVYLKAGPFSKKGRTCQCGIPVCKDIAKRFRDLQDVRGFYQKVPNPKPGDNTGLDKWTQRWCVHFSFNVHKVREEVCFNKTANETRTNTRSMTAAGHKKKDAYMAKWHYRLPILENFMNKNNNQIDRFAPISKAKALGLYHSVPGNNNFYTKADLYKEEETGVHKVCLIPNYLDTNEIEKVLNKLPEEKAIVTAIEEAVTESSCPTNKRGRSLLMSTASIGNGSRKKLKHFNEAEKDISKLVKEKTPEELAQLIHDMHASWKEENHKNVRLQKGIQQLQATLDQIVPEYRSQGQMNVEIELENLKKSGLNRFSMSNREYFEENKFALKQLFGFHDFKFLIGFIEKVLGVSFNPPKKLSTSGGVNGCNAISQSEQILMAMYFCNANMNYDLIGSIFGIKSRTTVRKYIDRWVPVLGETGDMLSTFTHWLDERALKDLQPEWYTKMGLDSISAIIDGKDFMTETIRKDRHLNCAQTSNKVNHSAFRLLTWSLPCGAVIQRTPAFFGRASEKAILRAWGERGRLKFPKGTCILGDKGFDNTAGSYTNFNTTLHPSFLTDQQFSRDQINWNVQICKKRYTCEVVYSRVVNTKKLQGIMAREHFKFIDSIVGWGHGLSNVSYGYLQKI